MGRGLALCCNTVVRSIIYIYIYIYVIVYTIAIVHVRDIDKRMKAIDPTCPTVVYYIL